MLRNLDQTLDHPNMTPELVEVLSTPSVQPEYQVEITLDVTPSQRAIGGRRLTLTYGLLHGNGDHRDRAGRP